LDPFKSEHEGYQGNYGNTVDRWYHRAAFVMWPRANTFALRAQASPQWAVDELLALPRANTAELESRVKTLLPRWKRTAGSVEGARFFAKLIKLSTRIEPGTNSSDCVLPELQARFREVVGETSRSPNRKFLMRRIEEALAARAEQEQPSASSEHVIEGFKPLKHRKPGRGPFPHFSTYSMCWVTSVPPSAAVNV
jgi:hypothetical protein